MLPSGRCSFHICTAGVTSAAANTARPGASTGVGASSASATRSRSRSGLPVSWSTSKQRPQSGCTVDAYNVGPPKWCERWFINPMNTIPRASSLEKNQVKYWFFCIFKWRLKFAIDWIFQVKSKKRLNFLLKTEKFLLNFHLNFQLEKNSINCLQFSKPDCSWAG